MQIKTEVFIILTGRCRLITCKVSPEGQALEKPQEITLEAHDGVVITPFTAHTLIFEGPNASMACVSNNLSDVKDLLPFKLV